MPAPRNTRREFLQGRSALEAAAALGADALAAIDGAGIEQGGQLPDDEPDGMFIRVGRRAMACAFEVLLNDRQYAHGTETALAALDVVGELEEQLSIFKGDSEVSRLNRRAATEAVPVEAGLFSLLALARRLWQETGGAFDVTAGPLSRTWGFTRRAGGMPDDAAIAAALAQVGSDKLLLDEAAESVRFLAPGMEINLGAIGKGHALDRAAAVMEQAGIHDFLIHGGQSSMLARGTRATASERRRGWLTTVLDPLRPGKPLATLRVVDRAVGTSGAAVQFFRHGGRRYGHILDPRSGRPARGVWSATVLAPTAAEADALSTACYVLGAERVEELCRARGNIGALLVIGDPDEGQVMVRSFGLGDELEFT